MFRPNIPTVVAAAFALCACSSVAQEPGAPGERADGVGKSAAPGPIQPPTATGGKAEPPQADHSLPGKKEDGPNGSGLDQRNPMLIEPPRGTPPPAPPRPTPVAYASPTAAPIAPLTSMPESLPFMTPRPGASHPSDIAPAPSRAGGEPAGSPQAGFGSMNELIVDIISRMPTGGGFAANGEAFGGLRRAIRLDPDGELALRPEQATPGFCSGATYLVFLEAIQELHRTRRLPISLAVAEALQMKSQPDGTGVWGRWNANGPGTARLFHELEMGRSFTSLDEAEPGDFLKIWWNENIGSTEKGHSAIFLGHGHSENGEPTVSFWSANQDVGYGEKAVPRSRIKRALVSRLENPGAIEHVVDLPKRDAYLSELMNRPSSEAEVSAKVGLAQAWARTVDSGAAVAKREAPGRSATSAGGVAAPGPPSPARTQDQAANKHTGDVSSHRKGSPAPSPSASGATKRPWYKNLLPL